jgi:hypothetical protein
MARSDDYEDDPPRRRPARRAEEERRRRPDDDDEPELPRRAPRRDDDRRRRPDDDEASRKRRSPPERARPRRQRHDDDDEDDYLDVRLRDADRRSTRSKNRFALLADKMAIFGLIPVLGLVLGPLAILFGVLGFRYASAHPEDSGRNMAIVGLILGPIVLIVNTAIAIGLIWMYRTGYLTWT